MNLINTILQKMSTISTPQRKFVMTLLTTIHLLRGKMTFHNLSRYGHLHEKTYARQFQKSFDFADCNHLALTTYLPKKTTKIAVIDWSMALLFEPMRDRSLIELKGLRIVWPLLLIGTF